MGFLTFMAIGLAAFVASTYYVTGEPTIELVV